MPSDSTTENSTGNAFREIQLELAEVRAEKEVLLSFSNLLASIETKEELLAFIRTELKRLFYFTHCLVGIIDPDKRNFSAFLVDPHSISKNHPEYGRLAKVSISIDDGVLNKVLRSSEPLHYDLEELAKRSDLPHYMRVNLESGTREVVVVALKNDKAGVGCLMLFSDRPHSFPAGTLSILNGISFQLSTAIANIMARGEIAKRENERTLLLSLSNEMASVRSKADLARIITLKLKDLFRIKDYTILIINEDGKTWSHFVYDRDRDFKDLPEFEDYMSRKYPVGDGLFDTAIRSNPYYLFDIHEILQWESVPSYIPYWQSVGVDYAVGIPLRIGQEDIGLLYMQVDGKDALGTMNYGVAVGVAAQVSIAVSNIIANENGLQREQEKDLLVSFGTDIASIRNKKDMLNLLHSKLKTTFSFQHTVICTVNNDGETISVFLLDPDSSSKHHPDYQRLVTEKFPLSDPFWDLALNAKSPVIFDGETLLKEGKGSLCIKVNHDCGIREFTFVSLRNGDHPIGFLMICSTKGNVLIRHQLTLLQGIASQLSIAVANTIANNEIARQLQEINGYRQQLEKEKTYLQEEIGAVYNYQDIVASGPAMQKVFHLVAQAAPTDSTVLILGETGTGKELIARAIHNGSMRKNRLMVKVNCAALPANLIESELFGHERGSFTGATDRRIGKFELADKGTLFLDEIGEMPMELQVKLLRVIQEKEIERVGGSKVIRTDVRIIAATNRNLQQEMLSGRFRSDLFYRLNVFPIDLPPLRDRVEDIPTLLSHFIAKYARKTGKRVTGYSEELLRELLLYPWPGNVRELEHLVERSVLLTDGPMIRRMDLPAYEFRPASAAANGSGTSSAVRPRPVSTIDEVEREHILTVLRMTKGKVFGPGGAAEMLGIPPTTLHSKIKRLGIRKGYYT